MASISCLAKLKDLWQRPGTRDAREDPTTNGGMQNGSSVGICTRCVHVFARLGADVYAQSVLINKVSASELSRKFIKVASLVGRGSAALARLCSLV